MKTSPIFSKLFLIERGKKCFALEIENNLLMFGSIIFTKGPFIMGLHGKRGERVKDVLTTVLKSSKV